MRNLLSFILMVSTLCSQTVVVKHRSGGGNSNGYTKGAVFTFNVHPASNLTAFPNYFHGVYPQLADVAHGGYVTHTTTLLGQTVPADFIFTSDTAGATLCNGSVPCYGWEIEKWDNTTGEMWGWVATDRSAGVDTLVYAWVGKSSVTTYQCTASATWNNNYKAVFHFPNTSFYDSTANGNTLTGENTPTISASQIDGGMSLVSTNAQDATKATTDNIDFSSDFTIQGWVKPATPGIGAQTILMKDYVDVTAPQYGMEINVASKIVLYIYGLSPYPIAQTASSPSTISWNSLSAVYVGATRTGAMYLNGSPDGSSTAGVGSYGAMGNTQLTIGSFYSGVTHGQYFNGLIDEVRLLAIALTPDWIAHEYRQQAQATAWYTVGSWTP